MYLYRCELCCSRWAAATPVEESCRFCGSFDIEMKNYAELDPFEVELLYKLLSDDPTDDPTSGPTDDPK